MEKICMKFLLIIKLFRSTERHHQSFCVVQTTSTVMKWSDPFTTHCALSNGYLKVKKWSLEVDALKLLYQSIWRTLLLHW